MNHPKLRWWTLGAMIYIFFSFFSFCECVCVYFYVWFCLYSFASTICPRVMTVLFSFSIVFSTWYHWWVCFLVWLLTSFLLFLFLIIIFYFNNFILFYLFIFPFFLSFFLPFILSREADRVLVLWLGVSPMPLMWESWVQDIGTPETPPAPHNIKCQKSPRDLHLNAKTQLHSMTSKLQCWTPYAKQLARQEHNPTH